MPDVVDSLLIPVGSDSGSAPPAALDGLAIPAALRLGMMAPSSNTVLEPVCQAIMSGIAGVSVHFARFRVTEISLSEAALGQFAPDGMMQAAELLADARVSAICWNGTSASWLGLDQDRELCAAIRAATDIPATSSVLALVELLREAGLTRIGLVTPYIAHVQQRIVDTLAAEGLSVVGERHLGLSENFAFATVGGDTLTGMIRAVAAAQPQAIVVLCTNLRAAPLAAPLEREIGIPILDSVATAVWGSLRLVGLPPARIEGWGRLFRGLQS